MRNHSGHGQGDHGVHGGTQPGGLSVSQSGYPLELDPTILTAGVQPVRFRVIGPDGQAVAEFATEHEKELHLIAVRRDTDREPTSITDDQDAAQFSLSHLARLITYPVAGRLGTAAGLTLARSVLAVLAGAGAAGALLLWPRHDGSAPVISSVTPARYAPGNDRSAPAKAA